MRKNKKLLVGFLAVNSILNASTGSNDNVIKNDKLFNKMVKNIKSFLFLHVYATIKLLLVKKGSFIC